MATKDSTGDMGSKTEREQIAQRFREFMAKIDRTGKNLARAVGISDTSISAKVIISAEVGEFRLYLKVLEETGGRPEEVRNLKPTDIRDNMVELWTRKTRHGQLTPRFVPITKDLHAEIMTWANGRTYLFEQRGNKKPRDQTWALKLQRKACSSAGVKYFSPHKYRHYRASLWLQEGINPVTIQEWLGHTSFATTTLYLRRLGGPWWHNQVQGGQNAVNGVPFSTT